MVECNVMAQYICKKNPLHTECSPSGQRKLCWQCGGKMIEKRQAKVVTKNGK